MYRHRGYSALTSPEIRRKTTLLMELKNRRLRRSPGIPRAAKFAWLNYPFAARVIIFDVFLGAVSLITPYWVYVSTSDGYATFGLWHYCVDKTCTSIHDNVMRHQFVPAWYHLTQGSFCIGMAGSIIGLGIMVNNAQGMTLQMPPTLHRACVCIIGIAALQKFVAVYTFVTHVEMTDFLYNRRDVIDLNLDGSFYVGVASFACTVVAALLVFLDEEMTRTNTDYVSFPKVYPAYAYRPIPQFQHKVHVM